jgi:hypothetical protein
VVAQKWTNHSGSNLTKHLGRDGSTVTGVVTKVSSGRIVRIVGSKRAHIDIDIYILTDEED